MTSPTQRRVLALALEHGRVVCGRNTARALARQGLVTVHWARHPTGPRVRASTRPESRGWYVVLTARGGALAQEMESDT